jgi:hypothetical protein
MRNYHATEMFNVELKNTVKIKNISYATKYPFNLIFRILPNKSNEFSGPGIYLIAFKENLIYIVSYSSSNPNIINDRWVKHIQTFTNRGYRLGFNSKTKIDMIPSHPN